MSLFFDADWFDARLAARGLDRGALAAAAGLQRGELHRVFVNERAATPEELGAFATVLGADIVEVTLRSGIAARADGGAEDSAARIESIEARLDAIDSWIEEFERARKRA
ncbi:MAG: hypothetical protein JNM59_10415 [Hyphomonadaceae bacterium]|nr:hypothetical protein [Hyphomonadaceae bacterium]